MAALGGVALLEEVRHWGWALRSKVLKPSPVSPFLFMMSSDVDVELSAPSLAPYLAARCLASYHDDNGLNL